MAQDAIKCPNCGTSIPLSEALSHDIEERARQKYQQELADVREKAKKELMLKEKDLETRLAKERKAFAEKEAERESQLKEERKALEKKISQQAAEKVRLELKDLEARIAERDLQLKAAQDQELSLRKKQRDLEERERTLALETERRLDVERKKAEAALEEAHRLKDAEKDKKLADALKQVEELKRKMEQGSQQTQGEVLELELEAMLKSEFPFDVIEPVIKGARGADVLQTVKTQSGRECGKILWETKRTKNWSDSWIQKLKDDKREAKAGLAVLVSESLPQGFHHFREIDGVWVTDVPSAHSLAVALRVVLIQVAIARQAEMGKQEKKDLIYTYITGPEFKNRVSAIIEGFVAMQEDLEREKRAMQKSWEKRAKQIEKIISNTAGMYGDLEGLLGTALSHIKILELTAPDCEDKESQADG